MINRIIICLIILSPVVAQFEGDRCIMKLNGEKGRCLVIDECKYAKELLRKNQRPQDCGYKRFTPIVCCPLKTKLATGQKSEKQCNLYYPRPRAKFQKFVFAGTKSLTKEFPHMAILGYGDKSDIQWLCGGSLISEEFVLTAAHCIISKHGVVKWVRLGDLDIKNTTDDAKPQEFNIITTYIYPEYQATSHYHDIALLKLNRKADFNVYVSPACLYTNWTINSKKLIATGWGSVDYLDQRSSHLLKVELNYIDYETCALSYSEVSIRKLRNGIIDELQVCAGDTDGKDTCPGDSGGPLQIQADTHPLHYYIVGITSFGKACGFANSVGVYTRIAQYIDWIEDIVWP